jgi:hypothetical protein
MGLFDFSLKEMCEKRDQRKLGEAIEKQKLKDIEHFLAKGTRRIDYLRYYRNEHGDMAPVGRYSDPYELAKHTGLPREGMELLARYGLTPESAKPAPTRGPAVPGR